MSDSPASSASSASGPEGTESPAASIASGGAPEAVAAADGEDKAVREERALLLKNEGNDYFKAGQFSRAIVAYQTAVELAPTAVLHANLAFAHLKMENYGLAINEAGAAISLDPRYPKGYYRRGAAHMALSHFKKARADLRAVVKLRPKDKDANAKLKEAEKAVKREAFEAAIAMEHPPPASLSIDLNTMVVPESYKGPHIKPAEGSAGAGGADVDMADAPAGAAAPAGGAGGDAQVGRPIAKGGVTREFCLALMETFKDQGSLHKKYCLEILFQMRDLLSGYKSLVRATLPPVQSDGKTPSVFNVCGDTHGQYYDLLNIFKVAGLPSEDNPYLFNGDFVDRGSFSVENVLVLFAWKLCYPDHFHLTRGNHETKNMNKIYGFEGEVKHKFDATVMDVFSEVFCLLPLATVINDKVMVVHGGLFTKDGVKLRDIEAIDRNCEPPEGGLMSDILWSDPQPFPGRGPSKRGVGQSFGPDITAAFLEDNGLELLIRSHEVRDEGYLVEHNGKCITVFSAPNYCDQMGNKGAVVRLGPDMKPDFIKYEAVPHPPVRPMAYSAMSGAFGF